MMTIVTHVHLRDGPERDWDAAMRTRLSAARKASGWVGGQRLRPAAKRDGRGRVGGWGGGAGGAAGGRAHPPGGGGRTSCAMSGKPQRRPANRQASRGGRARRRGHEG